MKTLTKKPSVLVPSLFNDFFDGDPFFSRSLSDLSLFKSASIPSVNIRENGKAFTLELAAPGMTKKDFSVNVEGNLLVITAEKEDEKNEENEHYTRREFSYNSFSRSFRLPQEANADKIKCQYEDGLLKVHIPKLQEAKTENPKSISIS